MHAANERRSDTADELAVTHKRRETSRSLGSMIAVTEFEDTSGHNVGVICNGHRIGIQIAGRTRYWWKIGETGKQIEGEPGSVFAIPAGTELEVSWEGPRKMISIGIDTQLVDRVLADHVHGASEVSGSPIATETLGHKPRLWLGEHQPRVFANVQRLAQLHADPHDTTGGSERLEIEEIAGELAAWMVFPDDSSQLIDRELGLSDVALRRITGYIRDHLREGLGIEALSDLARLSPFHFCRMFRRSTGLSPRQYVIRLRIDHSLSLMHSRPNMTLAEVAVASGFADQAHFSNTFRKLMRQTPSEWKREAQQS